MSLFRTTFLALTLIFMLFTGCSADTDSPQIAESQRETTKPTPVSTIGVKVDAPTPTGLPAPPKAVGNTPTESPSLATTVTHSDGLLDIDLIDEFIRCAMGKPAMAGKTKCTLEPAIERGLFKTGIKPKFPDNTNCRGIDDYWAMDYSAKRKGKKSYHGGIDMPAPFGTPIYAAANGTVVGKFLGENNLRGIEIVLRHSPQDTGLPVWTFSQYTHFSGMPSQEVGQRVRMGEFLGPTGNTGISIKTGKQSETRRPAIHFGVLYNTNGNYAVLKDLAIIPEDGYWMDPNAFFLVDHTFDTETLKALPVNDKKVPMPVLLDDGNTIPIDTKTVWPYACSEEVAGTTDPKEETPQTVFGKYLISISSCDTAVLDCHSPQNHEVYLAESENGLDWSLVPEWEPYPGSVPDIIRKENKLYVYDRQYLTKYDLVSNTQDEHVRGPRGKDRSKKVTVEGLGAAGYVDPSLIIDDAGRLVLFFMHGLLGADPAQCLPGESSCIKYFSSATEVDGSDGKRFKLDDGYRVSIAVGDGAHRGASDPDIFFDGNQYVLYISHGTAISVWTSPSLKGNYSHVGDLSDTEGGVPAGFYHQNTGKYWTFSHITRDGVTVIRRANHSDLDSVLPAQKWIDVISAPILGLPSTRDTGSPGFTVNE